MLKFPILTLDNHSVYNRMSLSRIYSIGLALAIESATAMNTRYVTILRHARAKQDSPSGGDVDRPLAKSGFRQLQRICQILKRVKQRPDWIVSSPALRTRQTAERVAELIGYTSNFGWNDRIYAAAPYTLLNILQETHDSADHVLLIGHNPGAAQLVAGLCSGADSRVNLRFPTAGLAHFEVDIARWRQLRWGNCELRFLIAPRFLKGLQ